ncbi:MAG TPA: DUF4956 domain-containing protein [Gammaproteobacteria bacterium]|jgi:hypothetical protein|nr:DUF4956 domain-containing protein [Gammaproteobacteria bacterium]
MRGVLDNVIVRLAVYYAAISALYVALLRAAPWLRDAVLSERARGIGGPLGGALVQSSSPGGALDSTVSLLPMGGGVVLGLIALTLIGALVVAYPVALVYQWTHDPEAYRADFNRALLCLPIVVAMAVFLVKNNLALAFSLAGIVAVIRWRATLREAMDGVFMFAMIGIGLAAGVQLLLVALVTSILFNFTILTLSQTRFANRPRQVDRWTLTAPAADRPAPPRRTVSIRVEAMDQARAEEHLATVLPLCAKQWQKSAASPQPNGRVLLEYRVTLKKSQSPESLVTTISRLGIPEIGGVSLTAES